MDEKSQTVIMQSIQDLERIQGHPQSIITTSLGVDTDDHQEQIQQLINELQSVTKARDQMTQRCLELDSQVIRIHLFYAFINIYIFLNFISTDITINYNNDNDMLKM